MKAVKFINSIILIAVIGLVFSNAVFAQETDNGNDKKERERIAKVEKTSDSDPDFEKIKSDKKTKSDKKSKTDSKADKKSGDEASTDLPDENAENKDAEQVVSYYSIYLSEYKLGPNDIISVEVFGQCPDYCLSDRTVPPTARLSYPLIREGVLVGGKTTFEVEDEITKQLNEYIIDPKVTVTLVKAGSARYAVMGKVGVPGVRIMDRKVSINEAILEAGGLAKGADRNKVFLARFSPEGFLSREQVDLEGIEKGKIPTVFLQPGDQVIVGEKGFTWSKFFNILEKTSIIRVLFGSPF
ncbi:MAG: polysaccharide biosynthesis/export family protein [Aridibacter sp.]